MKNRGNVLMIMPLLLGIASVCVFALYRYSANHAPYTYTGCIFAGPVLSFAGGVISVITRRSRKSHPALWTWGLIVCLLGVAGCVLVLVLVGLILAAALNGTWL